MYTSLSTIALIHLTLLCVLPLILLIPFPSLWLAYVPTSLILHTIFYGYITDFFNRKGGGFSEEKRLDGKTVVITGGNSGIGYATALDLARRGARVVLGCRNVERGSQAEAQLRQESGSQLVLFRQLDLADLSSIRHFSEGLLREESRIDILINNAGLLNNKPEVTSDGYELLFGVNHLGHFYLTHLLLDRIKESKPSRIINVSSLAHKLGPISITSEYVKPNPHARTGLFYNYALSKLANVLFTVELADRLALSGVETYSLHPGNVLTNINPDISKSRFFNIISKVLKTPTQGAQTSIYCAVSDEVLGKSGKYFSDCAEGKLFWYVNKRAARSLWRMSESMLDIETD